MEDVKQSALKLKGKVAEAVERIGIVALTHKKDALDAEVALPGFWLDQDHAREVVKEQAKLEKRIQPWLQLEQEISELNDLVDLGDSTMEGELAQSLQELTRQFDTLKEELKFSGPYDDYDAILSIHAGAGGADAQD